MKPEELTAKAQVVADQATCRTVDTAILGYLVLNDVEPTSVDDLKGLVSGDISRYSIVNGVAAGPGCATRG
ncbi:MULTISPECIES: hypothetical protein [Actinoplanes]|uniref:hypothetical protein n=1 Tax=Actinoplanes TaxID=1865 RepID=UPI001FE0FEF6|nr:MULTISPECIES: hypothetical protein [Actinoplanes]